VLKVYTESEGVVPPGTPLLELGDPTALEVVVDVLSGDAVQIPQGAKVEIERWGGEGSLRGHVRLVEPSAFTRISALGVEEQRVNVIIDLDEAKERWQRLGDGYRIEAKIVIQELTDVLQVPSSSVFRLGERWAVYRVVDGVVATTTVELGARNDRAFEVRSGLSLGDRVVSYPSASLSDGTQVIAR
jgi:HlyD family secretion protein